VVNNTANTLMMGFNTIPTMTVTGTNVGVGSTLPGQALDVTGTVRATAFIGNGSQLTGLSSSQWTTSNTNDVYLPKNGNVGIGTTITNAGAALSVMNGNVGIGTWVPKTALDVEGTLSVGYFANNVGIGTWLPSSPLTVSGAMASVVSGVTANYTAASVDVNYPLGEFEIGQNASDNDVQLIVAPLYSTNALQIPSAMLLSTDKTVNDSNAKQIAMEITTTYAVIGTIQQDGSPSTNGPPLEFSTYINGSGVIVPSLYIDSTSNQNVGIGTTTPGQTLDVIGTVRATAFIGNGAQLTGLNTSQWTTSNTNDVYLPNNGNVGIGTTITNAGAALSVINGNVGIGTWVTKGNLDVEGTLSTAYFDGNVGIGTWLPSAALTVGAGKLLLGSTGTISIPNGGSASDYLSVDASGNVTARDYFSSYDVNAGTGRFFAWNQGTAFYESGSDVILTDYTTQTMRYKLYLGGLYASNNIGIGTTLSSNRLDVQGAVGIGTAYAGYQTAPLNGLIVQGNVGIGTWLPRGSLDVEGTSALSIFAGNVGIGSTHPGQVLDVSGSVRATAFIGNGAQLTGLSSSQWTTSNANDVYLPNNGNVGIGTTITKAGAALSVMNGNVGIGTWVPDAQLDVEGTTSVVSFANNVGIGTWVPSASFQINEAGVPAFLFNSAQGNDPAGALSFYYSAAYPGIRFNGTSGQYFDIQVAGSFLDQIVTSPNDSFGIEGYKGLNFYTANQSAASTPGNNVVISAGNATGTGASSTGGNVYIYSGTSTSGVAGNVGINTTNGLNVGIGTITPGQTLDVIGTVRATAFIGNGAQLTGLSTSQWTTSNTNDVYLPKNGNVGIGTTITNAGAALSVINGNVGIGTWVTRGALDVEGSTSLAIFAGNVGIGSSHPGQVLDVQGTVRATVFIGNGSQLTGLSSSQWTTSNTNDVYLPNSGNVGIGTTITKAGAALSVMNGNVGIGTWVTKGNLDVEGTLSYGYFANNVGIGGTLTVGTVTATGQINDYNSAYYGQGLTDEGSDAEITTLSGSGVVNVSIGNLGVGSTTAGQKLDVQGTVRILGGGTLGIGTSSVSNAALTVMSGNVGIGTTLPGKSLDIQGTVRALGEIVNGNVGIGTSFINGSNEASLSILNGNVGIGTWVPKAILDVEGTLSLGYFAGNVGIGSSAPSVALEINGSVVLDNNNTISIRDNGNTPRIFASVDQYNDFNIGTNLTSALYIMNNSFGTSIGAVYGNALSQLVVNGADNGPGLAVGGNVVAPTGGVYSAGNVGIGTWVPAAGLDIETSGNSYFAGNVGIGSSAPSNGFVYANCSSHSGQASCWATNGAAGYCTSAVGAGGACTCVAC